MASTSAVEVPSRASRWYAGYAFDLDGTVWLDDDILPDARESILQLREHGSRVVFATNNPLHPVDFYAKKLTRLGIATEPEEVVTSLEALGLYLRKYHAGATLLPVAEALVVRKLTQWGFDLADKPEDADVVVVAFDREFNYHSLTQAYHAVRHGAVIVGTNPDRYCPTADGGIPDCAAMVAAIEACTGTTAEAIVGKPSPHMAAAFLDVLGADPNDAIFIGDRLETDVRMGHTAGMDAALVFTGATTREDAARSDVRPTVALDTLAGLIPR